MPYSLIAIIYNPNSTGPSHDMAKQCRSDILKKLPTQKIELIATKHAGHAETLAYDIAKANKKPLIISSSGDGGYHEVINGLMRAQNEGATPIAGLLPAGNANDHHRNLTKGKLADIITKKPQTIDLLLLKGTQKGKKLHRYGHSYVGFGLTPEIAAELNKNDLNIFNQTWLVIKGLLTIRSVALSVKDRRHRYDSVILSKVQTMSKVMTVADTLQSDDGKMALTMFRRRKRLTLIKKLLKSSLLSLSDDKRVTSFSAKTVHTTLLQIDGEISKLDANSQVRVTVEKQTLRCYI